MFLLKRPIFFFFYFYFPDRIAESRLPFPRTSFCRLPAYLAGFPLIFFFFIFFFFYFFCFCTWQASLFFFFGPVPAASTARACGRRAAPPPCPASRQRTWPSLCATPMATLRSSGDTCSAAARISRAASAGWRSASRPHATWSRRSGSLNRAASAIIWRLAGSDPRAGQAFSSAAAQQPAFFLPRRTREQRHHRQAAFRVQVVVPVGGVNAPKRLVVSSHRSRSAAYTGPTGGPREARGPRRYLSRPPQRTLSSPDTLRRAHRAQAASHPASRSASAAASSSATAGHPAAADLQQPVATATRQAGAGPMLPCARPRGTLRRGRAAAECRLAAPARPSPTRPVPIQRPA